MKLPLQKTAVSPATAPEKDAGAWLTGKYLRMMMMVMMSTSPATAPEKELDGVNHTLVGRPQEEGMMQFSGQFSLSMKPRFNRTSRSSSTSEGCQRRNMMRHNTRDSGADVEPAHNTIKLLCPNVTVRLSISPAC